MNDQVAEMYEFAKRVAFKMTGDPEAQSIAGTATLHAIETFDPSYNVPLKRWVARCVKLDIWGYWRKVVARKEEQRSDHWWAHLVEELPPDLTLEISDADRDLLFRKYVLKWPNDVIGNRMDPPQTAWTVRKALKAAIARLECSLSVPVPCIHETDE